MRSEHTTASSPMGKLKSYPACCLDYGLMLSFQSLLSSPFDYSQAFDAALKQVVKTLPGRPAKETADETVRIHIIYYS
jgi:hypothetical protein